MRQRHTSSTDATAPVRTPAKANVPGTKHERKSSESRMTPSAEKQAEYGFSDAEIAARAYSYWEARGFVGVSPEEDWYRAINELTLERSRRSD
jgi:hypothetical protein